MQALRVFLLGPAAIESHEEQKSPDIRAALFNVRTVRDTLIAFVSTVVSHGK